MKKNKFFILFLSGLFILSTISCEIGLGASVDIARPSVEISYPPSSAVVRNSFVLAGSCEDDNQIESVSVLVRNTETKATFGPYAATLSPDAKSWQVVLNQHTPGAGFNGWEFPDGKVEFQVTSTDTSQRVSDTATRTVEIDNTAPFFMLEGPYDSNYGTTFTVKGTIQEEHSVAAITMQVYDSEGNVVSSEPFVEKNISKDVSRIFAKHSKSSVGTTPYDRYVSMYGSDMDGKTRPYTCSIEVSDNAHLYIDPSEDVNVTSGNTTSVVYPYAKVYADYMAEGTAELDFADLANILNGTYNGVADSSAIKEALLGYSIDTCKDADSRLNFTLNSDRNPRYTVNSFDFNSSSDPINVINVSNGNSANIVLYEGLNNTTLDYSSINVWTKEITEYSTSTAIVDSFNEYTTNLYENLDNYFEQQKKLDEGSLSVTDPEYVDYTELLGAPLEASAVKVNSTSNTVASTLSNIVANHYYLIVLTGKDLDGYTFTSENDNVYVFKGTSSTEPPKCNIVAPTNNSTQKNSEFVLEGTYEGSNPVVKVDYDISVYDEITGEILGSILGEANLNNGKWKTPILTDGAKNTYKNKDGTVISGASAKVLLAETEDGKQYQYHVFVKATDDSGNSSNKAESYIYIDSVKPIVSITGIKPTVDVDDVSCVNGLITVSGEITEDGSIESVVYEVYENGNSTPTGAQVELAKRPNFNITNFDTRKYADNENITIKVIVTDKAGNQNYTTTTIYNSGVPVKVLQSTDKPVVDFSNADPAIKVNTSIKKNSNLFGSTSNNKLMALVTDDDGLATVTVTVYKENKTTKVAEKVFKDECAGKTTYSLSYELPKDSGNYWVTVVAKDNALGETNNYSFMIAVHENAPEIKITSPENNAYMTASFDSLKGTVSNVKAELSAKVYKYDSGSNSYVETADPAIAITKAANSQNWTGKVTMTEPASGRFRIVFTAKDEYELENTATLDYQVDIGKPSVSITELPTVSDTEAPNFLISGTATDAEGESGIAAVRVKFTSSSSEEGETATGTEKWTYTVTPGKLSSYFGTSGIKTVYVMTTDKAGNKSDWVSKTFNYDTQKPEVAVTSHTLDGKSAVSGGANFSAKMDFSIAGTWNDDWALADTDGIVITQKKDKGEEIVIYDSSKAASATYFSLSGKNWTLSKLPRDPSDITKQAAATVANEGYYTYKITVTDKAAKSDYATVAATCDITPPAVEILAPANNGYVESATTIIRGTAVDYGAGVTELKYTLKKGATVIGTADTDIFDYLNGESWRLTGTDNKGISLGTGEGTLTIKVTAKDALGMSGESTNTFYYDLNDPKLTETAVTTTGLTTNTGFSLEGQAWDTNSIAKVVITEGEKSWASDKGEVTWTNATIRVDDINIAGKNWSKAFVVGAANKDEENYLSDGEHTFTIQAYDIAGKVVTTQRTVMVDTVAPVKNSFAPTNAGKSITVDGNTNAWYNSKQIEIKVTASDATSGVTAVAYSTDYNSSTKTGNWNSLTNKTDGWYGDATCDNQGANSIWAKITDKAGNETIEGPITLYVDTVGPDVLTVKVGEVENYNGTLLVNGKSNIPVKVTASDESTYVNTIKVYTTTITPAKNCTAADMTLKMGDLVSGGVTFVVTDILGNKTEFSPFMFEVDKEDPTAEIGGIADADSEVTGTQVNGIITISGTAMDNRSLETVELQYLSGASTWTEVPRVDSTIAIGTYNWSYTGVDTTSAVLNAYDSDKTTPGTQLSLRTKVTDTAGNTGYSAVKVVTIDQDTDRPIIRVNNMNMQGMLSTNYIWHKQSSITGIVNDDDGDVKGVYISLNGEDWSENCYDGGSWLYDFAESAARASCDGSKTIYFKVIDAKDKEFISSTTSTTVGNFGPKIVDRSGNRFGYLASGANPATPNDIIYATIDTQDPEISGIWYNTNASLTATQLAALPTITASQRESGIEGWVELNSSITEVFGGPGHVLNIKYVAFDTNGIYSTGVALGSNTATSTGTYAKILSDSNVGQTDTVIARFDVSASAGITTGKHNLSITLRDKATGTASVGVVTKTYDMITVDNDAPVVDFKTPAANSNQYGSVGVSITGKVTEEHEITGLYYGISTRNGTAPANYTRIDEWTSPSLWTITFDEDVDENLNINKETSTVYHASLLKNSCFTTSEINSGTTKVIYVYVYAVDEYGNTSEPQILPLNVNPVGDKPAVTITYPATADTIGGFVRITGTTTIATSAVKAVYVQIDPTYESSFNDSGWKAELEAINGSKSVGYTIEQFTGKYAGVDFSDYGIKATGTQNWNLTINKLKELNTSGTRNLALKVYAVSETNNVSDPVTVNFSIDASAPRFGDETPFKVVQYDNSGNEIKKMIYEPNMWITTKAGEQWYLVGSAEDDSGIKQITYSKNGEDPWFIMGCPDIPNTDKPEWYTTLDTADDSASYTNYTLKIPVGDSTADKFGRLTYDIEIYDASDQGSTLSVILNYDNKAPVFKATSLTATDTADYSKNIIQQDNGTYTFRGNFEEASNATNNQSSFERIAMYFTRTSNSKDYLIDPMLGGGADGKGNYVLTSGYEYNASDNLYWKKVTGAKIQNNNEITNITVPANVRPGSLVKINNIIYTISNIATQSVTTDGVTTTTFKAPVYVNGTLEATSNATVYFAFAQVIDNTVNENFTTSEFVVGGNPEIDESTNDDGDQMAEGVTEQVSSFNWKASINTENIFDGKVVVHFVAFDRAGNSAYQKYYGKVSNNAPRIAGVVFGTDENGDNKVTDGSKVGGVDTLNEFKTTYSGWYTVGAEGIVENGEDASGKRVTNFMVPMADKEGNRSAVLTVKGLTVIKPEIVGGNTDVGWDYYVDGTKKSTSTTYFGKGHSSDKSVRSGLEIQLGVAKMINDGVADGTNKDFKFVFSDKTEDNGGDTAAINIMMNVALQDKTKPTVKIDPFYWKSVNDNSVYYVDGVPYGHIELESDWAQVPAANKTSLTANISDADPKVSGIIQIKGQANDNVLVKELLLKIPGFTTSNAYQRVAYRDTDGEWKTSGVLATNGWTCEVTSDEFDSETGNTIDWVFTWNTAKITNAAVANVKVNAQVKDRGKAAVSGSTVTYPTANQNTSVDDTTSTTSSAKKNLYQMDVVPYISKVYTAMAALQKKESKWSTTSRSSNGHYPVRVIKKNLEGTAGTGETIKVYGYNLKNAVYTPYGGNDINLVAANDTYGDYVSINAAQLVTASNKNTGLFQVKVNSIPTLNNINYNNAAGSFDAELNASNYKTYAYNRQPNGDNNNLLTDDVYFDVWEFNSAAAVPISGKIEQPVMKIRPSDGKLGFAFVNGPLYFSMGGSKSSQDYSYQYWTASYDFFTSVGFTYDDNGDSWGVAAGGDINDNSADRFILTSSNWGIGEHAKTGSYNGVNSIRLEQIAQKNDGTNFFDKQRIKSPSLVTSVHENATNVYLAYYDALNEEIRFKAGSYGENTYLRKVIRVDNNGNQFRGGWVEKEGPGGTYAAHNGDTFQICDSEGNPIDDTVYLIGGEWNPAGDQVAFTGRVNNADVIPFPGTKDFVANQDYTMDGGFRVLSTDLYIKITSKQFAAFGNFQDSANNAVPMTYNNSYVSMIATSQTAAKVGQYVSLAVIPGDEVTNDTVIAVWYDETAREMMYSYTTSPMGQEGKTDRTGWSTPVSVFGNTDYDTAGEYCKITVDAAGGVHIAAYDPTNLDLVYAYLPSAKKGITTNASDFKTCIVDGNGVVGSNLTLDVAIKDGRVIPYIGYYSTSTIKPKIAYYVGETAAGESEFTLGFTSNVLAGTVDDEFTGSWECSLVPTANTVEMQSNLHNDINIGVWKNAGTLIDNATDSVHYTVAASTTTNNPNGYASASTGQAYGNGTSNAILGYAVKHGASGDNIETAQIK